MLNQSHTCPHTPERRSDSIIRSLVCDLIIKRAHPCNKISVTLHLFMLAM